MLVCFADATASLSPRQAGLDAASEGEHARALDHFDWAVSARPDWPHNYLDRAKSRAAMGDGKVSRPSLQLLTGFLWRPSHKLSCLDLDLLELAHTLQCPLAPCTL